MCYCFLYSLLIIYYIGLASSEDITPTYPTTTEFTVPAGVCPYDWIESLEGCFLFHYTGGKWTVDISVFSRSLGLIENLTWREAQTVCEDLGGYLAEIRSQDQQTFMVEIWNIISEISIMFSSAGKYCPAGGGIHRPKVLVHWSHGFWSWGKVIIKPSTIYTIYHLPSIIVSV